MTTVLLNLARPRLMTNSLTVLRLVKCDLRSSCSSVLFVRRRSYATDKRPESSLATSTSQGEVSTNVKEIVKETTKTVSYMGVILAGIGVTAVMFYTIFSELFSKKSPNSVYSQALMKCSNDNRVKDALGEPIKGFGEETRRGRRRYTQHVVYNKDGVEHLRMKFYLKGSRNQGTVHLEMKEDSSGNYMFRYLFVQLDDYTRRVIVLEDNRQDNLMPLSPPRDHASDYSSPLNLTLQ